MYHLAAALMGQPKTLSEEELLQGDDIGPVVLRLAIAFGLIAVLVLSLDIACNDHRPQTVAAGQMRSPTDAP